jgi:hypothetical protein
MLVATELGMLRFKVPGVAVSSSVVAASSDSLLLHAVRAKAGSRAKAVRENLIFRRLVTP